jgi:hypothetical protein
MTEKAKDTETNTIKDILHSNEYNTDLIRKPPSPQKQNKHTDPQHQKTNWVTFTYSGKEVTRITELFQEMRTEIIFHRQNTIQNILKPQTQRDKYSRSGIYQMKCLDFPLKYIG